MGYLTTPDSMNPKFTGQVRDNETGIDFFNARYFSGAQGRFQSTDPGNAGANLADPQTWNMFAYVGNNPLSYTDPSGMMACGTCIGASVGGPIGAAVGAAIDIGFGLYELFSNIGGPSLPPLPASTWGTADSQLSGSNGTFYDKDPCPNGDCAPDGKPGLWPGVNWWEVFGLGYPFDRYLTFHTQPLHLKSVYVDASQYINPTGPPVTCQNSFANSTVGRVTKFLSVIDAAQHVTNLETVAEWTVLPAAKVQALNGIKSVSNAVGNTEFMSITGSGASTVIEAPAAAAVDTFESLAAGPGAFLAPVVTAFHAAVLNFCQQLPGANLGLP